MNIFLKLPVYYYFRQIIRTVLKRFPPCTYGRGIKFTVESHSLFNRHSVRLPVIHKDKIILPTKTSTTCFRDKPDDRALIKVGNIYVLLKIL